MVNASPDPKAAVKEFVETLFEEGLLKDVTNCHGERLDTGATTSAGRSDTALETVGVLARDTPAPAPRGQKVGLIVSEPV
jgi:hypothetical protein